GRMPRQSQNWNAPFSPRAALCCAMDSSTGLAHITSSNHPRNLGFTSTELPNGRWRRWASQRASSPLSTERATAIRPTVARSFAIRPRFVGGRVLLPEPAGRGRYSVVYAGARYNYLG